jgi:hypothetical protein
MFGDLLIPNVLANMLQKSDADNAKFLSAIKPPSCGSDAFVKRILSKHRMGRAFIKTSTFMPF